MKFLLDENVHRGLFSFLSKLGHDVKLSSKGMENSKIFDLAVKEKRLLITRDAHFSNSDVYPPSKHFGIWLVRVPPEDLEAQRRAISKLLKQFPKAEELKGKVIVLLSGEKFEFLK